MTRPSCLDVPPLTSAPPLPPEPGVAADLDSDDRAARGAALDQLDGYLGELERWAWSAEAACR